jgi:putative Mg2+ transporter-C (MgtC) family protein
MEDLPVLTRLAVTLALSAAVGWERESVGKSAGLRTHMFVGLGATLFVVLSEVVLVRFREHGELVRVDPLRIIEAIVAAVGFLGAGTIFVSRGRDHVVGLTTAASMWVTAAIGAAVGFERYVLAVGATVLVLIVLRVLLPLSQRIGAESKDDQHPSP